MNTQRQRRYGTVFELAAWKLFQAHYPHELHRAEPTLQGPVFGRKGFPFWKSVFEANGQLLLPFKVGGEAHEYLMTRQGIIEPPPDLTEAHIEVIRVVRVEWVSMMDRALDVYWHCMHGMIQLASTTPAQKRGDYTVMWSDAFVSDLGRFSVPVALMNAHQQELFNVSFVLDTQEVKCATEFLRPLVLAAPELLEEFENKCKSWFRFALAHEAPVEHLLLQQAQQAGWLPTERIDVHTLVRQRRGAGLDHPVVLTCALVWPNMFLNKGLLYVPLVADNTPASFFAVFEKTGFVQVELNDKSAYAKAVKEQLKENQLINAAAVQHNVRPGGEGWVLFDGDRPVDVLTHWKVAHIRSQYDARQFFPLVEWMTRYYQDLAELTRNWMKRRLHTMVDMLRQYTLPELQWTKAKALLDIFAVQVLGQPEADGYEDHVEFSVFQPDKFQHTPEPLTSSSMDLVPLFQHIFLQTATMYQPMTGHLVGQVENQLTSTDQLPQQVEKVKTYPSSASIMYSSSAGKHQRTRMSPVRSRVRTRSRSRCGGETRPSAR